MPRSVAHQRSEATTLYQVITLPPHTLTPYHGSRPRQTPSLLRKKNFQGIIVCLSVLCCALSGKKTKKRRRGGGKTTEPIMLCV